MKTTPFLNPALGLATALVSGNLSLRAQTAEPFPAAANPSVSENQNAGNATSEGPQPVTSYDQTYIQNTGYQI